MYKVNPEWYCDICGKKIENYHGYVSFNELADMVERSEEASYDICGDCMRAFLKWKDAQRKHFSL